MSFGRIEEVFSRLFSWDTAIRCCVVGKSGVIASHQLDDYRALYAIDTSKRVVVPFKDDKAFIDFVNMASRPLANLDKAYLYLCLYSKVFNGGFDNRVPWNYPADVYANSIFAEDDRLKPFYYAPWMALKSDRTLSGSTIKRIVMYSFKRTCNYPPHIVKYRHQFRFDDSGNLIDIEPFIMATK